MEETQQSSMMCDMKARLQQLKNSFKTPQCSLSACSEINVTKTSFICNLRM